MVISKFYFKISGDWVYQGQTYETSWSVGTLDLQYAHVYEWRVDVEDAGIGSSLTGDTWTFTIKDYPASIDYDRPDDYDSEQVWGWDDGEGEYGWLDPADAPSILAAGGGRYGQRLIAIGHRSIYFGSL